MAAHLPPNHDVHNADRDALAWLAVQLGAEPIVPPDVRARGDPTEIINAALARLPRRAPCPPTSARISIARRAR